MGLKSLCKFIMLVSLLFICCNITVSASTSTSTSVNAMKDNVATEQAIKVNVLETRTDKTVRVVSKCVICFLTIGLGLYSLSLLKGKEEEPQQQHQQGKEVSQENNEDIKEIEEENQKEN